ncbi:MAG TPA: glutaredoxin domain-containing protein [Aggregatilineaceae bacterium]|nr:glutaredoxin domain-containing protein [Aggregatilineaceae bacterium]
MTDEIKKKKQKRVIVFSTPTCTYCNQAKRYFREKGVRFTDIDVSKDAAAARDMVRRSGQQGVPVIDIGGRIIVGFNKPEIDRLLS